MSDNAKVVLVSLIAALAVAVAWAAELGTGVGWTCFMLYAMFMMRIRSGFGDPAVVTLFVFILYATLPLLVTADTPPAIGDFGFDLAGATYIYHVASVALIGTTGLAFFLLPVHDTGAGVTQPPRDSYYVEAIVAAALSMSLSAAFIAKNGMFDITSADSYTTRFTVLTDTGTGVLMMSGPLAAAATCFVAVSLDRFRPIILLTVVPFFTMFMSLGQRKYLLIPFVIMAARFFRIRSVVQMLMVLLLAIAGYIGFSYVGFLRVENIGLDHAFTAKTVSAYIADINNLNEEPYILYVTAAAAYGRVLDASFMSNYVGALRFILPHLFFGTQFEPIENRFAHAVIPDDADMNAGLGFSYFGEAYIAGGILGIVLATGATTFALRAFFRLGGGLRFQGVWGAVALSCTYYAMWYMRISFGLFLREAVQQVGAVLLTAVIVRTILRRPRVAVAPT